jgi:hypothetical protein
MDFQKGAPLYDDGRNIKRAMECTVNKCRCSQYRKHLSSEQFKCATYHIRYWRKLREIARQLRNSDGTTSFYKTQASYPADADHSATTEIECQRQITRGITKYFSDKCHGSNTNNASSLATAVSDSANVQGLELVAGQRRARSQARKCDNRWLICTGHHT